METCIMILEDKPEEQAKALKAVMKAFDIVHDPVVEGLNPALQQGLGVSLFPCGKSGEPRSVMVFIADNLEGFWQYAPPSFFARGSLMKPFEKTLILTDLMFPGQKGEKENMWGIEVVIGAIEREMNVVVCSDTDHHDVPFVPSIIRMLAKSHPKGKIPVVLDNKDWDKAVALGLELLNA